MTAIATIKEALADISDGKMVILVDDEDRENEGDLVVASEKVTPEHINFMCVEGRGLICLSLDESQADRLELSPMARHNRAPLGTAFTGSIDHKELGGIGAKGRAATIRAAIDGEAKAADFVTPGHVFPLRAREGGVLVRSGQTEGSVDLSRLAGLAPSGVICEVMSEDGTMTRLPSLLQFGSKHDIKVVTVADLIAYRLQHEPLVKKAGVARLPTAFGTFNVHCFEDTISGHVHVALVIGTPGEESPTLVRVHRADTVADVFGLEFMPSRSRLAWCMQRMAAEGCGVLLYLRSDGGGSELSETVKRYGAAARGEKSDAKPGEMNFHNFGIGAQMLTQLGLSQIRVMTNRPRVFKGLNGFGLQIVDWLPIQGDPQ